MPKKSAKEMFIDRVSMRMQRMPKDMPMKDSDMPIKKKPPNKSSKKKGK